jgi:hypothetical protein
MTLLVRCDYEVTIDGEATPEQIITAFQKINERSVIVSEEIDGSDAYAILFNSLEVSIVRFA